MSGISDADRLRSRPWERLEEFTTERQLRVTDTEAWEDLDVISGGV